MDSIKNSLSYLAVAITPAKLICFDTWIYELITVSSSQLSLPETAGQSLSVNSYYPLIGIPFSMSIAATIIVGKEIGANRVYNARLYANMIKFCSFFLAVIIGSLLFFYGDEISKLFTNIEEVQAIHRGI